MSTATPPNTTLVDLTISFGWTCEPEPLDEGYTGPIDCDPDLDPKSGYPFVLVLNVDPDTPDGTGITVAPTIRR